MIPTACSRDRLAMALSLAALVVLAPRSGWGQSTSTDGTQTDVSAGDFLIEIWRMQGDEWVRLSDFERERFFNKARCECGTPVQITLGLTPAGTARHANIRRGRAHFVVGTDACVADVAARNNARCVQIGEFISLVGLRRQGGRVGRETTVTELFTNADDGCDGTRRQENIRLFVDMNEDGEPDLMGGQAPNVPLELDSLPPPAPSGVAVTGGNEALQVSWDSLEGLDDFLGYVVMCSRGENLQVFSSSPFKDQYQTRATQCPGGLTSPVGSALIETGGSEAVLDPADDAENLRPADDGVLLIHQNDQLPEGGLGPFVAPGHFSGLNPSFLCSDLLTTQTTHRIGGLQNGIPYLVGVAAVDKYFNPSPIQVVYLQTPIATRDFYRGYRDAGGTAEGGYCAIAPTSRRDKVGGWVILLGAAVLALGQRAWSRRRHG